jgi:hypothetical protein
MRCPGRLAMVCRWLLLGLALWAGVAQAQSLESALRPGDVVRSHAKWEDECAQCHVRFNRAAQNERCMNCHKDIGADVLQQRGHHGRMKPQPCRACHTDHKGRDARIVDFDPQQFDHRHTDYELRGKHRSATCDSCHAPGRKYSQAPHECVACHRKDDTHKGSLGPSCADCHQEDDWKQTRFDHGKTRFPLLGRHIDTRCADCHRSSNYKEAPRTCVGCHRKDDDSAKGHQGRFGDKCDSCHDSKAWAPSRFNHDRDTRFVLRGKHRPAECKACHTGTLFKDKTGSACVDCHRKDDKHEGRLGAECQACHVETDWKQTSRFDHDRTTYPLLGQHRQARCESCHQAGRYKNTPTACISCHRKDDKHQPSLGESCQSCHSERDWKEVSRFDHGRSRFPLRERHAEVRCNECHRSSSNFREAPRECVACHRKDDKHEGSLGTTCADCHGERRWVPARAFDHQRTRFALRHAHAARSVTCKACHADAKSYRPTPTDCASCHTKDDKHEGQLGKACDSCHDDTRWGSVRFDHARARFVLVGRHLAQRCDACHQTARYRDAARDCDGCHRKDDTHQRAYGTNCDSCHNARGWRLWNFDHQRQTHFKLDGAHLRTACKLCHTQPAPAGRAIADVGNTCVACHSRVDKHDGAFGSQCERCHNTTDWRQISQRVGSNPATRQDALRLGGDQALGAASWFRRPARGPAA